MSWSQAAELVGCPVPTIETYVHRGRIERRQVRGRGRGSLKRNSVAAFAVWWIERSARLDQRKADVDRRRIRPLEAEGWTDIKRAVEILGCKNAEHLVYLGRQGVRGAEGEHAMGVLSGSPIQRDRRVSRKVMRAVLLVPRTVCSIEKAKPLASAPIAPCIHERP